MVHLVQVDVIGLQSSQAVFAGLSDVAGGQTPVVGPQVHGLIDVGGQHDPVAPTAFLKPAPDNFFGDAEAFFHIGALRAAIDVGGVKKIDAGCHGLVHDSESHGFVRHKTEIHGSETKAADLQAGTSKLRVLHVVFSLYCVF